MKTISDATRLEAWEILRQRFSAAWAAALLGTTEKGIREMKRRQAATLKAQQRFHGRTKRELFEEWQRRQREEGLSGNAAAQSLRKPASWFSALKSRIEREGEDAVFIEHPSV